MKLVIRDLGCSLREPRLWCRCRWLALRHHQSQLPRHPRCFRPPRRKAPQPRLWLLASPWLPRLRLQASLRLPLRALTAVEKKWKIPPKRTRGVPKMSQNPISGIFWTASVIGWNFQPPTARISAHVVVRLKTTQLLVLGKVVSQVILVGSLLTSTVMDQ